MRAYEKLYGELPNWRLATGAPAKVKALWKAIGVMPQKAPIDEPVRDWMTGKQLTKPYDVAHQDVVVAIGAAGRLPWITTGRPDARGTKLAVTLQEFLNDEGRANYQPGADASSWTAADVSQAVEYVRSLTADRHHLGASLAALCEVIPPRLVHKSLHPVAAKRPPGAVRRLSGRARRSR